MAAQPFIRAKMKQHFFLNGFVETQPTETGAKEIDVFHPSYRVKRILKQSINNLKDDIILDVIQNEKRGFITLNIDISTDSLEEFLRNLIEKYIPADYPENLRVLYKEMLKILLSSFLVPEMKSEMKEELVEIAENFVTKQC